LQSRRFLFPDLPGITISYRKLIVSGIKMVVISNDYYVLNKKICIIINKALFIIAKTGCFGVNGVWFWDKYLFFNKIYRRLGKSRFAAL
jgi:hypothetical protein